MLDEDLVSWVRGLGIRGRRTAVVRLCVSMGRWTRHLWYLGWLVSAGVGDDGMGWGYTRQTSLRLVGMQLLNEDEREWLKLGLFWLSEEECWRVAGDLPLWEIGPL